MGDHNTLSLTNSLTRQLENKQLEMSIRMHSDHEAIHPHMHHSRHTVEMRSRIVNKEPPYVVIQILEIFLVESIALLKQEHVRQNLRIQNQAINFIS
jgi:hypothetical protein